VGSPAWPDRRSLHLQQYAFSLQKIDCEAPSRKECLRRVAERARTTPPGEWILGHGWNQNDWPEGFGSAGDLDAAVPDHPVYLTAKSLHAGWANSTALRAAGITVQTGDPPGGRLQRDPGGVPSGILFETAMQLVAQVIPEPSPAQIAAAIRQAQTRLWQMGLTGVHDFDRQPCFSALQLLQEAGELGLRVVKSILVEALPQAVEPIALGSETTCCGRAGENLRRWRPLGARLPCSALRTREPSPVRRWGSQTKRPAGRTKRFDPGCARHRDR
jgi:predicted amidohydrolase YtcJ